MKPCSKNRKLLAWLVLDELAPEEKSRLLTHLDACEGCRAYFQELSRVSKILSEARFEPNQEPSVLFHRRLVCRLRTEDQKTSLSNGWQLCRRLFSDWRVAVGALGIALLGLLIVFTPSRPADAPNSAPQKQAGLKEHPATSDFEPTISHYKAIANQSFELFNQLLNEQGSRNLAPTPIYTASTLPLGTGAD